MSVAAGKVPVKRENSKGMLKHSDITAEPFILAALPPKKTPEDHRFPSVGYVDSVLSNSATLKPYWHSAFLLRPQVLIKLAGTLLGLCITHLYANKPVYIL